ncbi:MAG: DNA replication/repair protein RecF [Marinibacterium sp.]
MAPLALTSLTLSHFRSHMQARLELDNRPVAIFGPNGSGKTNLLEAVSLFSPGRGLRRASAEDMARRPEVLGWKLSAMLTSGGHAHEVETWSEPGSARQVRIDSKAASQLALGRLARVLWLVPSMDRLWMEGADGRRRFLDRMVLSLEPGHAESVLAYERAMRERNRLIREDIRDPGWFSALEAQMARAGHLVHQARIRTLTMVTHAQAGASTAFPAADLELQQSAGALPETEADLREALAESRFRDIAAGRALIGPHRTDLHGVYAAKGVAARDCSTGEQKALLVSLILANARALAAEIGTPPILLLDEVAAHLDEYRRAALYDEVCDLGAQAWMTGTGPELFSELADRAQAIEVTETGGISTVRPGTLQ